MDAMKPAYAEALALWRTIGDKAELANALYNYSFAFAVGKDPKEDPRGADPDGEGARAQEEALALYRQLGDRRGEANLLWGMGNRQYFSAEADAGVGNFEQALAIFREVGDATMAAWSLHMLGGALLRLGRPDASRPFLHEALRTFQASGDAAGIALMLDDLTSQAVADGDVVRAARIRGAARRLSAETGANLAVYVDEQFEVFFRPGVTGALPLEELQRLEREGAEIPLDSAIEYALGGDFLGGDIPAGSSIPAADDGTIPPSPPAAPV
jgi:tetratricopeptide (TPR) repeat protein